MSLVTDSVVRPWSEPIDYRGLEILSPMVRAASLPMRLCCLRYGADLAYHGVVVDHSFIETERIEDPHFGTVDYYSRRLQNVLFSTCEEERSRVIFQIGTCDSVQGLRAAVHVCRDVRGIDVNMGCTAPFSAQGGMGAALLDKPEVAADILKTLRRELPNDIPVTCKIRLLPTQERTRDFLQLCERSGAAAVAVHMRMQDEMREERARWEEIHNVCSAVQIPIIANGDFLTRRHITEFWDQCSGSSDASSSVGPAAVMVARGALWNPSIFHREESSNESAPEYDDVVRNYLRTALECNSNNYGTKWVLSEMSCMRGPHPSTIPNFQSLQGKKFRQFKQRLDQSKGMSDICDIIGVKYDASLYPHASHTMKYHETTRDRPADLDTAKPTDNDNDCASTDKQESDRLADDEWGPVRALRTAK